MPSEVVSIRVVFLEEDSKMELRSRKQRWKSGFPEPRALSTTSRVGLTSIGHTTQMAKPPHARRRPKRSGSAKCHEA
jgi:hypothetical protein